MHILYIMLQYYKIKNVLRMNIDIITHCITNAYITTKNSPDELSFCCCSII